MADEVVRVRARAYELPEVVRHRFLSREEYFDGIVFDKTRNDWDAGKVQGPTSEETNNAIFERLKKLRKQRGWDEPMCDTESRSGTRSAAFRARRLTHP